MRQLILPLLILVSWVVFTSCSDDQQNKSHELAIAEIRNLNTAFNEAVAKKDIDQILKLYANEMIWLPPNEKRNRGLEAVKRNYMGITTNKDTELSHALDTVFISSSDDLAVMIGTYYFRQKSDQPVSDTGKFSLTLVKKSGTWKIYSDTFSSDLPFANNR